MTKPQEVLDLFQLEWAGPLSGLLLDTTIPAPSLTLEMFSAGGWGLTAGLATPTPTTLAKAKLREASGPSTYTLAGLHLRSQLASTSPVLFLTRARLSAGGVGSMGRRGTLRPRTSVMMRRPQVSAWCRFQRATLL